MGGHDTAPESMTRYRRTLGAISSIQGALYDTGLDAVMLIVGATDPVVIRANVEQVLFPTLAAGDIVVMENLRAQKGSGIRKRLRSPVPLCFTCCRIRPIVPINNCWSKLKANLLDPHARLKLYWYVPFKW